MIEYDEDLKCWIWEVTAVRDSNTRVLAWGETKTRLEARDLIRKWKAHLAVLALVAGCAQGVSTPDSVYVGECRLNRPVEVWEYTEIEGDCGPMDPSPQPRVGWDGCLAPVFACGNESYDCESEYGQSHFHYTSETTGVWELDSLGVDFNEQCHSVYELEVVP